MAFKNNKDKPFLSFKFLFYSYFFFFSFSFFICRGCHFIPGSEDEKDEERKKMKKKRKEQKIGKEEGNFVHMARVQDKTKVYITL